MAENQCQCREMDLNIINAKIVTPAGIKTGAVSVKDGKIAAIVTDDCLLPPAKETIDVKGKHLLPGLVDPEAHVGCYNYFGVEAESETVAAAATGVTTWGIQGPSSRMGMKPFKEIVSPEDVVSFKDVFDTAVSVMDKNSMVDYFFTYMLETDEQGHDVPYYAKEQGVTSYKLYMHCKRTALDKFWGSSRAGLCTGFDDGTAYLVMENVAKLGKPSIVSIHAENWEIARIFEQRLIDEGRTDFMAWTDRSPGFLEAQHVRAYAYVAKELGCPLYIQHATTAKTMEEIKLARYEGVDIHAQVGPVWLYFTGDDWRINVPLRRREDIEAMWEALAEGVVDCVGSDHVLPWPPMDKESMYNDSIWKLRTGFTSRVECALPIMLSEGVNKNRISIERLVEVCSENPAKVFGLYPKKGSISVGADADFVVVDLNKEVKVTKDIIFSRSGWSMLEGHTMNGWPVMTILRGNVLVHWPDNEPKPVVVGKRNAQYQPRKLGSQYLSLDD